MTENIPVVLFRLTLLPAGDGPYERWELTVEATGEVVLAGRMPVDETGIRNAATRYRELKERGA